MMIRVKQPTVDGANNNRQVNQTSQNDSSNRPDNNNKQPIRVGSFIQLPVTNFKPTKPSSKRKLKQNDTQIRSNSTIQQHRSSVDQSSSASQQSSKSQSTVSNKSSAQASKQTINRSNNIQSVNLTDEDREKKLNEFVDKIKSVFNQKLIELKYKKQIINEQIEKEICSTVPCFEWFVQDQLDLDLRRRKFFSYVDEDDYLIGHLANVSSSKTKSDTKKACFNLICFDGGKRRLIHDLGVCAYYLLDDNPVVDDLCSKNENRYFRFRVHKIIREQIFVTFAHSASAHDNLYLNLGLIGLEELPEHFRKVIYLKKQQVNQLPDQRAGSIYSFDTLLHSNKQFRNPISVDYLLETLQIDNEENFFKSKQFIESTDQVAKRKLNEDLRSGINCLKQQDYEKAELFLNKVIKLEPNNTDAHVAIGCLLANQSKYTDSMKEFELALKLDDKHANARKYLIEILLANGKKLYKEKDYESSLEMYKKVLIYDQLNEEAKKSIQQIDDKLINIDDEYDRKKKKSKRSPESFKRKHH